MVMKLSLDKAEGGKESDGSDKKQDGGMMGEGKKSLIDCKTDKEEEEENGEEN